MSLPYLQAFGWHADVLTVEARSVGTTYDPLLATSLPERLNVIRAQALPVRLTRLVGVQGLAWRALWSLYRQGHKALKENAYDLVFFSTTVFPVIALGRLWQRRFGVPYVVDFQDPWQTDYYDGPHAPRPPGGRFKFRASQLFARVVEPAVMRKAAGFISVSVAYSETLLQRYGWLRSVPTRVLPFAGSERDFEITVEQGVTQSIFDAADGKTHWVYAGVAGAVMAYALRGFFHALRAARAEDPDRYRSLVIHFIGTDYAPGKRSRNSVQSLAEEFEVGDLVTEHSLRIPYFEALRCLLDADALVVPGSDDPAYTASKIYPYLLARKPLLAIFHEESPVVDVVRSTSTANVVTFRPGESLEALSKAILKRWFSRSGPTPAHLRADAFSKYTAREMTRVLCLYFDDVLAREGAAPP